MTKTDLVNNIAKDVGITKTAATKAVNSLLGNMTKELMKKDGKVTLIGFGTFSQIQRKARKGRNPQTGETIEIKASKTVKFKPGKKVKQSV